MNIDKALEIIKFWGEETEEVDEGDFSDAVQLGVEALKRLQDIRHRRWQVPIYTDLAALLPGETED